MLMSLLSESILGVTFGSFLWERFFPSNALMKHRRGDINIHFEQNTSSDDVFLFIPTTVQ